MAREGVRLMSKVMITVVASTGETQRLWVTLEDTQATFTVTVGRVVHRYNAHGQALATHLRPVHRRPRANECLSSPASSGRRDLSYSHERMWVLCKATIL